MKIWFIFEMKKKLKERMKERMKENDLSSLKGNS
jgi:hypothetical protein